MRPVCSFCHRHPVVASVSEDRNFESRSVRQRGERGRGGLPALLVFRSSHLETELVLLNERRFNSQSGADCWPEFRHLLNRSRFLGRTILESSLGLRAANQLPIALIPVPVSRPSWFSFPCPDY